MGQQLQQNYACLILERGVHLQPGQLLVLTAPLCAADFVHILVEQAFGLGARDVVMHYVDAETDRMRLLYADQAVLTDIPEWKTQSKLSYIDKNACFLHIASENPTGMAGVPEQKSAAVQQATSALLAPLYDKQMDNSLAWCVAAVPNVRWAKKVFPALEEAEAVQALWQAILSCCYVTYSSGVDGWDKHVKALQRTVKKLNALKLHRLHFQNDIGTDLWVDICDGGIFAGGIAHCPEPDGLLFAPNLPSEEIFTTPHRLRTQGTVYNTLPLVYNGGIIDDFRLTFTDGLVTDWSCGTGHEAMATLLATDEGSRRLGEVALVPYASPVNRTGVLFYDTLFDENASCHLALGAGYTDVMTGKDRSPQALVAQGLNASLIHVDLMFGSADMRCTGYTMDGSEVPVFFGGNFAL